MKDKFISILLFATLFGLFFHSACETEDCAFEIVGTWTFTISVPNVTWTETLTFTGSSTGGDVTGWQVDEGEIGSYTVTNCDSVQISYDYYHGHRGHTVVTFTGNGAGNSMNGTLSWYDDYYGNSSGIWNAIKL